LGNEKGLGEDHTDPALFGKERGNHNCREAKPPQTFFGNLRKKGGGKGPKRHELYIYSEGVVIWDEAISRE